MSAAPSAPPAPRPTPARTISERELRRLHFINALFSHITGHDLYLAAQIKEAIAFSLDELVAKNVRSGRDAGSTDADSAATENEAATGSETSTAQAPRPPSTDGKPVGEKAMDVPPASSPITVESPHSRSETTSLEPTDGAPTDVSPTSDTPETPVERPRCHSKNIDDAPFYEAAARLLKTAFAHHFPERGFYHWDAAQSLASVTPLFARDEILLGLRHLAPYRESTLLITNLRPTLIPAPKRATPRRAEEYRDLVDFIRQLAATHSAPASTLQLLFL